MLLHFYIQDSGCLICWEDHGSKDCPERKPEHCPDCHIFIRICSDHSSVCGMRTWKYKKYEHLYVAEPSERCVIGFNSSFRFLKDGSWRKGNESMDMLSPISGALFRFKTDKDLALLSNTYVPVRIVIVVKAGGTCEEKLLLMTSKQRVMVATTLNRTFDREDEVHERNTTLVLAAFGTGLVITVSVQPQKGELRTYELPFDELTKAFAIPEHLNVASILPANMVLPARLLALATIEKGPANKFTFGNEPFCTVCFGKHHTDDCQESKLNRCPECHVVARNVVDHAPVCTHKNRFVSQVVNVYVKVPAKVCTISMDSPIYWQTGNEIQMARAGLLLFSPMCDLYVQFTSSMALVIKTTDYTRIRLPFIIQEPVGSSMKCTEKLAIFTSRDRTLVVANGSRPVVPGHEVDEHEHCTPLVLYVAPNASANLHIQVFGDYDIKKEFTVKYNGKKFNIPKAFDVCSSDFNPLPFSAEPQMKKK